MGIRKAAALASSAVSTAALQHIFRRPAGNFPGKIALYLDPAIIKEMSGKLRQGSVCVVGTNGKTTVTNMLADSLIAAGRQVVCNRTGANLDSGVATSLLHAPTSDWGVFECDELWLAKVLPWLQSNYVILLNLFYDQLDRVGDVNYIQESIIGALQKSPQTTLIYNADDPHCEKIARLAGNPSVPFGMGEDLALQQTSETPMCQMCDGMLEYSFHTYAQLGAFSCSACDFKRANLKFMARNFSADTDGMNFDVVAATDIHAVAGGTIAQIHAPYTGTYMAYNLLAVYAAGHLMGLSNNVIQLTMNAFNPHNGRLEHMDVCGQKVVLNLAKNPTGFNQNIDLVCKENNPVAVAFFVNDMEGDGRDVSWLWDVNFEQLAGRNVIVFAGGMRANEVQLRLKYAGIPAQVVQDATGVLRTAAGLAACETVYLIANYTSLPEVRNECEKLSVAESALEPLPADLPAIPSAPEVRKDTDSLRIMHLFPDLLDQGGDSGNVVVLEKRCIWRGIPVQIQRVTADKTPDFEQADIVVLGDGFDRQQRLACNLLLPYKEALSAFVKGGGVLLAIDGGLQILGSSWFIGEEEYEGLGVLDIANGREKNERRHVGDIVVQTTLASSPVIGFENHAGTTLLGSTSKPFGSVVKGIGNNAGDSTEGILQGNVLGTYVHGPLLAKNPEVADWLLTQGLHHRGNTVELGILDNTVEKAAHTFMCKRLNI